MWKNTIELVNWSKSSAYYFHSMFKFSPKHPEFLLTGMHALCTTTECNELWRNMVQILPPKDVPWLMANDLNEVCI